MKKTIIVSKYTFIEVYRSKLMVGLAFLFIGLIFITYIASEFAYGAPEKIALDFSLGIMSISNIFIAIVLGSNLLQKEIDSKTLYMILSRPISRSSFIVGKFLGLSTVLVINTALLGCAGISFYLFLGGEYNNLLFIAVFFCLIESFILLLFGVLFSLITTTTMSVVCTISILVFGHLITDTTTAFFTKLTPFFVQTLKVASWVIPDLEKFNIKDFIIYKQSLPDLYLLNSFLYGICFIILLFLVINLIFQKKNLD